jgi:hypothetical protein
MTISVPSHSVLGDLVGPSYDPEAKRHHVVLHLPALEPGMELGELHPPLLPLLTHSFFIPSFLVILSRHVLLAHYLTRLIRVLGVRGLLVRHSDCDDVHSSLGRG